MGKTIGLQQLAAKKYVLVDNLPPALVAAIGEIEDAFDAIVYGDSNHGKSSFIAAFIIALVKSLRCKCEYIAFEEAHGKTVQDTMISRYNMLEEIGNALLLTDHYTFDELKAKMARKKSAKIWVIDSLQASSFTSKEIAELKRLFVTSKKKKILLLVSWAKGSKPLGADACAVEYYANIKMQVKNLLMFPKSRYGGGDVYVIHEETARKRLGDKEFQKLTGKKKTTVTKKKLK